MKYAHNYVWGTQYETKPIALPFGKAVHKAAETYYRNLKETGEIISVNQVISVFETVLKKEIGINNPIIQMNAGVPIS